MSPYGEAKRQVLSAVRAVSIRARLLLVFGCLVLLMLFGSVLPLLEISDIRSRVQNVSLVEQRMTAILRLNNKLLTFVSQLHRLADRERSRNFAVEANRLLATFQSETRGYRASLAALQPDTEREAVLLGGLGGTLAALPDRIASFIELARAKDWLVLHARLANEVDETDEVVAALMRSLDQDLMDARKDVADDIQRAQVRATRTLAITGVVSLITAAVLGLVMTRSITRPLIALDRGARALARGQFGHKIAVTGNDELADLAKVFNRASEELADLYSQVRNSEIRFRSLIEKGTDLIMVVDSSGLISYCSPSSHHVLGYDSKTLIGRPIRDLLCDDDLEAGSLAFAPGDPGPGQTKSFEFGFRCHDRSSRRLEGVVRDLSADPAIAGLIINARDISIHRLAEQAVKRSEKQLRLIADALPVLISYVDVEQRYRFANRRHEDWFSISSERMIGKRVSEVIGTTAYLIIRDHLDQALRGEPVSYETALQFDDGSDRHVRTAMIPDIDDLGEVRGVVSLVADITADRRAAEALRRSEERERSRAAELEAIMDAAPIALFISHDAECRRVTGSRATYELWGMPRGADFSNSAGAQGMARFRSARNGIESHTLPGDFPLRISAQSGVPVQNYEFDVVFEDGGSRRLLGNSFPLLDENGRPCGAVAGFLDVTERRRMDERLRQAQKAESIGLLAGGVAHDFNNILTAVSGNISFALDDLNADCAVRPNLEVAMQSVQRAAGLTRQLLAYAGKGAFVREPVIASDIARNAVELLRASVSRKIELRTELVERVPPITMDPSQLEQVVMNLVLNGAEAIGEAACGVVTVRTAARDGFISIEVEDTGCGIDEATQKRMFDPFFTTKFVGRGLGLAAVQGIVHSLSGEIMVDSVVGRGARIEVILPADSTPPPTPSSSVAPPVVEPAGAVLIVDDEPAIRELAAAVLRQRGIAVFEASTGREAVDLLSGDGSTIRAVLLDMTMPGLNGEEALPAIVALRPDIQVIVSSGYSASEVKRHFGRSNFRSFLPKPYTMEQLLAHVLPALSPDFSGAEPDSPL